MSGEAQSAVALRCMIREFVSTSPGNGEDLQNINTSQLPDGAQCFVTTTRQLFRFRKFSTISAVPDYVIVPSSGGGRWVLEGIPAGALPAWVVATNTNTTDASGSGDWLAPNTDDFSLELGGGAWAFTALGCILTYTGPTARYLFRVTATLTFAGDQSVQLGIAHNDDLTGTAAGFLQGIQFYDVPIESSETVDLSAERMRVIANGSTIRPKFRLSGTAADLDIERLTLSATPVS
jgi:hypothetical protein